MLPYLFDEPVEHVVDWSFATLCRYIGGEQAVQSPPPPRELPADKTTPLSKILALQEQKKHHEDNKGGSPSWEEYQEIQKPQKEERKLTGGWFGFGKKDKEE
jgi:mitochondrial fission process protein 1